MEGFLPLVEALLAFALTMAALSSAVSAAVGSLQRAVRLRAWGLRQQVEYLFRNELQALLDRYGLLGPDKPLDTAAIARRRFLVDMILIPEVHTGVAAETAEDARENGFQATSWFGSWRALANCVENLSSEEFAVRFRASRAGEALAAALDRSAFDDAVCVMRRRFDALCAGSSESFARRSRQWCLVASAILVVGLNVNALELLNAYLSDPNIRLAVIQKQLEQGEPATENDAPAAGAPDAADKAAGAAPAAPAPAPQPSRLGDALGAAQDALAQAADVNGLDPSVSGAIAKARQELADARELETTIRGVAVEHIAVAQALAESFPIGWSLYPNCVEGTVEPSCLSLTARVGALPGAGKDIPNVLAFMWEHDRAGMVGWLGGLFVTIAMLGLGAPFWVETAGSIGRLRSSATEPKKTADGPLPVRVESEPPLPQPTSATPTPTPRRRLFF